MHFTFVECGDWRKKIGERRRKGVTDGRLGFIISEEEIENEGRRKREKKNWIDLTNGEK